MQLSAWRGIRLRERVLLWLLPALVFRALIPVGFMPGTGPVLALELCSAAGFGSEFALHDGAGAPAGHDGAGSHEACAFAASATAGPAPELTVPVPVDPAATRIDARTSPFLAAPGSSLRPPPRAPPSLA